MLHYVSPGIILALALTLTVAQVTRVVAYDRGPFLWDLILAAVGLIAGEVIALSGHFGGITVGVLHPVVDLAVMIAVEVAGAVVITPRASGSAEL